MLTLEQHADIICTHILMGVPHDDKLEGLTLEEAYDLSDMVAARLEKPMGGYAGYKIAWNAPHLMERFNMPHPGFGRVFQSQVSVGSVGLKLDDYREFMFEPEIVARLGRDIAPGQTHTPASVGSAVEGFSAGFELLDRRGHPAEPGTGPEILAHNIFNAGAVIGVDRVPPYDLNEDELTTRLAVNGSMVVEEVGIAPQPPLEAIAFLANHYCGRGYTMRAGSIILCGSHTPLQPVSEPSRVSVTMGRLGAVEFDIR